MEYRLQEPFTTEKMKPLRAGDRVLLTGTIYTARDAAHKRMVNALQNNQPIFILLKDAVIYYVGSTSVPKGRSIG